MGYECRLCKKNFFEGHRLEITMPDDTILSVYLCGECIESCPEQELFRLVLRKILH